MNNRRRRQQIPYISPSIPEGEGFLLYCESEYGEYKLLAGYTPEDFTQVVERGWFEYRAGDTLHRVYPAIVQYLKSLGGWNFILQQRNEGGQFTSRMEHFDRRGNPIEPATPNPIWSTTNMATLQVLTTSGIANWTI